MGVAEFNESPQPKWQKFVCEVAVLCRTADTAPRVSPGEVPELFEDTREYVPFICIVRLTANGNSQEEKVMLLR